MTLQQVKEQVAKKYLYKSWEQLRIDRVISDVILDEVSKEYAKQIAEQTLKDVVNELCIWHFNDEDFYYSDIECILKTPIQLP